jgi:hypothetical protein
MTIRGVRDDEGDELSPIGGQCDALIYPEDVAFWSDEEREAWREEIAAKVARRKPLGFAPWPDE